MPKTIKNTAFVINLDEYAEVGMHWIALYAKNNEVIYFDNFGVEHILEEIKKFIGNKNIKTNIFRLQAQDSIMCGYFCIGFIDFMFGGENLTDYTSLFSPYDFKKNDKIIIIKYFSLQDVKMSNSNLELNDLTKYRLDEINKIKDYFNVEIKERKDITKKLSKYIVVFYYADKLFITLSASFGTLSIVSHATVVGIPVGLAGASLIVILTVTTGIVKKLLNTTRKKEKKHNKIILLAKNKLNIIETLMSHTLTDFDKSHEEFKKIIDEKDKYEQIKDNIKTTRSINDLNKGHNDRVTNL